MRRLLYVPVAPAALEELCRRAERERRRPQDEAALLLERALGVQDAAGRAASGEAAVAIGG